jgi:hypothetical protein
MAFGDYMIAVMNSAKNGWWWYCLGLGWGAALIVASYSLNCSETESHSMGPPS